MEQANIRQATSLQVFYNESENVNIRTQVINDEPWFVAKDVAMALNVTWSTIRLITSLKIGKGREYPPPLLLELVVVVFKL